MEERKSKVMFEFAGVPVYQSDLSEEAIARLNKELVEVFKNEFNDKRNEKIASSEVLTSQSLKEMLVIALKRDYAVSIISSIMLNPNLEEIDEEAWRNLSKHKDWRIKSLALESRFLTNERVQGMLSYETKVWQSSDMIAEILSNPNLKEVDEELWKNLSKNKSWEIREVAAESRLATNERLQEMLKHEMKRPDIYVVKAIISSSNLKEIDEEVWRNLSKSVKWAIRAEAAKSKFATNERLQEMFKYETKVGLVSGVIEAILSNSNLKEIDEELWKELSKDKKERIRELAAESRFATRKRLVKMFEHEMENPDSGVMEAIMSNKNFQS